MIFFWFTNVTNIVCEKLQWWPFPVKNRWATCFFIRFISSEMMTYEVMKLVWQCIDDRLKSGNLILGADIIVSSVHMKHLCSNKIFELRIALSFGLITNASWNKIFLSFGLITNASWNKIFELHIALSFGLITNASWKTHNSEVYYESASCKK